MRRKDPNEDIIRRLMGKPPRKKGGVKRNPNYKGPKMPPAPKSFLEKLGIGRILKGRKAMGRKKKPAVVKPKKK